MHGFMRGFMRGFHNQIIAHTVRTLVCVRTKRYSCCYWSSGSVDVAETSSSLHLQCTTAHLRICVQTLASVNSSSHRHVHCDLVMHQWSVRYSQTTPLCTACPKMCYIPYTNCMYSQFLTFMEWEFIEPSRWIFICNIVIHGNKKLSFLCSGINSMNKKT